MNSNPNTPSNSNSTKVKKKSFSKITRYYFDNAITKSSNFVIFLVLIAFVLGLLMTFFQLNVEGGVEGNFFDKWWDSVTKILKLGKGKDWYGRVMSFMFWAFSIAISGTIIGFLSSKIREVVAKLKKGKSSVIVKNHTVILGWSTNIFSILKELSYANESVGKGVVVILSALDNEKMQDELKNIAKDTKHLTIVTRYGNPANTSELEIANPQEAKSIIILNNGGTNDPQVITTILALGSILENKNIPVIASIKNASYAEVMADLNQIHVIPVLGEEIISNVTAQACRQPGLGEVFLDLLDFSGDEIYAKSISSLNGKTYQEALISFEKSSVIGIERDNKVQLIPPSDTIIKTEDKLVFVSEDDDTIYYKQADISKFSGIQQQAFNSENKARNVLFIGWSKTGQVISESLIPNLSTSSKITIAYQTSYITVDELPSKDYYSDVNFSTIEIKNEFASISKLLDEGNFQDVIILGYSEKLSTEEADTTTLIYMLHLDKYLSKHQDNPFRVVAQLLDSSKAKLAQFTKTDELIVSDNLAGLLMAQLSENPNLHSVFNNLFDDKKANINIYPIEKYIEIGKTTTYEEIVYRAGLLNESSLGIRRNGAEFVKESGGLYMNPSKNMEITAHSKDFLIVINQP